MREVSDYGRAIEITAVRDDIDLQCARMFLKKKGSLDNPCIKKGEKGGRFSVVGWRVVVSVVHGDDCGGTVRVRMFPAERRDCNCRGVSRTGFGRTGSWLAAG